MPTDLSTAPTAPVGAETTFVPSAFKLMNVGKESRPQTACASCPSGIWFKRNEWHCFCNVMKFQPWSGDSTPIQACDARETSLARYNAEEVALEVARAAVVKGSIGA